MQNLKTPIQILFIARSGVVVGLVFNHYNEPYSLTFYMICFVVGHLSDFITIGFALSEKMDVLKGYINLSNALSTQTITNALSPTRHHEAYNPNRYAISETKETMETPYTAPFAQETPKKRFEPFTTQIGDKTLVVFPDCVVLENSPWSYQRLYDNIKANKTKMKNPANSEQVRESSTKLFNFYTKALELMKNGGAENISYTWAAN